MNINLIHFPLVSTDPFITSLTPLPHKQTSGISKYVLLLIALPHQQLGELSDSDRTDSGSSKDEKSIEQCASHLVSLLIEPNKYNYYAI